MGYNDALQWLSRLLGPDYHKTTGGELARALARQTPLARRRLVSRVEESLLDARVLEDEHSRVLLARVLVSLIPDSVEAITTLLRQELTASTGEVHFSLFVALSDVAEVTVDGQQFDHLLAAIETYLLTARADYGQAAWMAGDLLGDHWRLEQSLPVLLRVVQEGRYVAGREGAIHGLSHALDKAPKAMQWTIVQALKETAHQDRSGRVRRYAESVIADMRGL